MDDSFPYTAAQLIRDACPGVIAVYLFGSSARGDTHSKSDVDLAFLPPEPLDNVERWHLQEDLSVRLHRDVDLVDLRAASTVMKMQVLTDSTVLFESDETARHEFEMHTYSAYALLNEERAGILSDIQERGRVYGR